MERQRAPGYGRPYGQIKRRDTGYLEYADRRGMLDTLDDLIEHAPAVKETVEPLLNMAPDGQESLTLYDGMVFLSGEAPDSIERAVMSGESEWVGYEVDRAERAIGDALAVLSKIPPHLNREAVGAILTLRSDVERIRGLAETEVWN
jgi:hypothetical protein